MASCGERDGGLSDEQSPLLNDTENQPRSNGSVAHASDPQSEDNIDTGSALVPEELSNARLSLVIGSVWVGVFFGALDSTIIATLVAAISTSFNSLSLLSWLASAYLIAQAACQPLSGRLTDIFSRRTGLLVANGTFALGNLICGLATEQWVMILGRVVSGAGGGGIMAISTFISSDLVPLRKRGVVQGIGNIAWGLGSGLGGTFGGWINDVWGWRKAFLVQVPFMAISTIAVFFLVRIPVKENKMPKLKRIDFLGAGTLVTSVVLLMLAINSGGNTVPWNHPLVWISLPLSALFFAVFVWVEENIASEPIIPIRLVLHRTVFSACLTNWFCSMATFAIIFYTPIYFQITGLSTMQAGFRLIPQSVGLAIGSLASGLIMKATGRYYLMNVCNLSIFLLGMVLITTITPATPVWAPFIFLFLAGFGQGSVLTVTLTALISAVDHQHQAVVTSASYAFRSTGSTIGVTIASGVFQNILKKQLWARLGGIDNAAKVIKRVRDSFDEIDRLPPDWRQAVVDSYMDALRSVFILATGLAVLGLASSLFMREHKLHTNLARTK
ncbi:MAG: hypothetical protein M1825_001916 [Sarcosagium campestre]|nr:MAG: hypothetical protein M1825_001916 [Sarcosagium campestre]